MMKQVTRYIEAWRSHRLIAVSAVAATVAAAGFIAFHYSTRSEPAVAGGSPVARLISAQQYANAMRDLFGEDVHVAVDFASPQRRQGLLSLGAADIGMTPGLFNQYEKAARDVAAQVVDERRRGILVPCEPRSERAADDACAGKFFARVGRFLYRRPLSQSEQSLYVAAASQAAETFSDFYAGLAHALAAMMVSPQFLYFVETIEADPDQEGRYRLDAYSKATRLSLFLWNSIPDEALLIAAEHGKLHEQAELERQAERMLEAPQRLERGVRAFFADLLLFDNFAALTKDAVIYPAFTPKVSLLAQEQALRLITDHLLTRRADYRDLFTTPRTFVEAELAPLQRVPMAGGGWRPVALDGQHSAGVLTSLGFLALHSHPGRSSPTLRGKAIREALLCQKVPDPPPNVDFSDFEASLEKAETARERLALHSTDPTCAGCHKITDPVGLAFENFDGAGQLRTTEKGAAIDASGDLDGAAFADVAGFGRALRAHPALAPCLVSRLYAYAVGHETTAADRPWLARAVRDFADDDYRYSDLLMHIAKSRAFYAVAGKDGRELVAVQLQK